MMTDMDFQTGIVYSEETAFCSSGTVKEEIFYSGSLNPVTLLSMMEEALDSLTAGAFCAEETETERVPNSFLVSVTTADPILPPEGAPKKRGRKARQKTPEEIAEAERAALERRLGKNRKPCRRRQIDPTTCERDYSDEEVEFMKALDLYKRSSGRMFPTCSETLEVLRNLGYVKMPKDDADANRPAVLIVHNLFPEFTGDSVFAGIVWREGEIVTFLA